MRKCVLEDKKVCVFNKERQGKINNKNVCNIYIYIYIYTYFTLVHKLYCIVSIIGRGSLCHTASFGLLG